ncbi:MAG: carbon dioxide concentrating mechanism protein CcmL [Planctomycetota bacterium]|nr:MAG: carbon dioxide concentrating mechanism protein CcmL [Planctomycetota bacterium]
MRMGKVIGTVTLHKKHPALVGGRFKIVVPYTLDDLLAEGADFLPNNEELISYDDLNAGVGELVAFSEGPESARPYFPELKPMDTNITAILDTLDVVPLDDVQP